MKLAVINQYAAKVKIPTPLLGEDGLKLSNTNQRTEPVSYSNALIGWRRIETEQKGNQFDTFLLFQRPYWVKTDWNKKEINYRVAQQMIPTPLLGEDGLKHPYCVDSL